MVEERDRHGHYTGAGDLVRRTGLRPQTVHSLVMAGAFDGVTANRREALWDAGLPVRPPRNGQRALPLSTGDNVPELPDFTAHERMAGEYAVMGIYPRGHVMEFVRPTLRPTSCAPPTSMHCLKGRRCWWRGGPWPDSIPGVWRGRCS